MIDCCLPEDFIQIQYLTEMFILVELKYSHLILWSGSAPWTMVSVSKDNVRKSSPNNVWKLNFIENLAVT